MDEQPQPPQFTQPEQTNYISPDYAVPPTFRPTSTLAVWSLVNGILGWMLCPVFCSMIAVVTGHMALGEIRRLNLDGKGIAIAGLALGYSMLALGLLIIIALVGMAVFFGSMSMNIAP